MIISARAASSLRFAASTSARIDAAIGGKGFSLGGLLQKAPIAANQRCKVSRSS
jgi:hypothetical protein